MASNSRTVSAAIALLVEALHAIEEFILLGVALRQEQRGEEAHFVARPVKGIESRVVLVGRHDRERRRRCPGGEVVEIAPEPAQKLVVANNG